MAQQLVNGGVLQAIQRLQVRNIPQTSSLPSVAQTLPHGAVEPGKAPRTTETATRTRTTSRIAIPNNTRRGFLKRDGAVDVILTHFSVRRQTTLVVVVSEHALHVSAAREAGPCRTRTSGS